MTQAHRTDAESLINSGLAASQANDIETALDFFARASAASPASALPHFLIGSEYAALGQTEQAEAALANAVLLAPDLHLARYQFGLLQFSSGRAAVALVTWAPLLSLGDEDALSHFVKGFAGLAQDDFAAARGHFELGLARNHCNAALSGDIRKVLAAMDSKIGKDNAALEAAAAAPQDTVHVLVSNYGKLGTLH